jgi:hypothetical protein
MDVDAIVGQALARVDLDAAGRRYRSQDEVVLVEDVLPEALTRALADEARSLRPLVTRGHVPFVRKGGTVVYPLVLERAPLLVQTYTAPSLMSWLAKLGGAGGKTNRNDHATANLYYYDEPGDWMRHHHDSCSRCDVGSQTVILGLIDRSRQQLRCRVRGKDMILPTAPGSLVVFSTARTCHGVSPLGTNEERVVACVSYTPDRTVSILDHTLAGLQESVVFFGLRGLLPEPWRKRERAP